MLERLGVTDPAGYMASNAADSLALEEVFVSPRLVSQLEAAVEEAVVAGSWTDALANLPTAIGPKDAASLLSKAVPRHVQGELWFSRMAGLYLFSPGEDMEERHLDHSGTLI